MINVIDQDKCIGCGTCFKSCSLDVFRLDTDQSKVSPCMAACPAGTDIRGYNALVQQGKLEEAAQKLRQANPFPGITGRICFHPCEKECARNAVDGAVNINAVEQFLGEALAQADKRFYRTNFVHIGRAKLQKSYLCATARTAVLGGCGAAQSNERL